MERTREEDLEVRVRSLAPADLGAVVAIDEKNTGRRRDEYLKLKFRENLSETGIRMSLAAEVDGVLCGFLLARVYYGEFGRMEPAAVLDTIAVHPEFHGRGVGAALLAQLRTNLAGVGVSRVQTEVSWADAALLGFFRREGFTLSDRLCLELDPRQRLEEAEELS
jgi:ribosomal protein S18 acetylase RimI-like enzyme